ncbi:outer membrane protein assembly factor BamB family protein [Cellulomonas sp. P5_C6]
MRGRDTQAVELADAESTHASQDNAADASPSATRSTTTLRWALAGGAALLVAALAATQGTISWRQNAAIARLAAVQGVVPELDGHLDAGTSYSAMETSVLVGSPGDGRLVRGPDGSLTYHWGPADHPTWTTQVLGPVPALAGALSVSSPSLCAPDVTPDADATDAPRVVCLITDGGTAVLDDQGRSTDVPATATFVEVLDTASGAPLARWPAPATTTFTLLDGQIIVGTTQGTTDIVTSRDVLSGAVTWTHEVPLAADPPRGGVSVSRFKDMLILQTSAGRIQLLSPDGHVIRDDIGADSNALWGWQPGPTGRLVLESWDEGGTLSATLLAPDANPDADRTLTGGLAQPGVDDGSVPGLLLTADTALHAWDADTGAPRWTSPGLFDLVEGPTRPSILVIRSRVYVLTSTGVLALDGSTGEPLWRIKPDKGQVATTLLTDAHHLFVGYERADQAGNGQLVAYPFDDGAPAWHMAYPNGIDHVVARAGKLVGYDQGYTTFTLLD